MRRVGREVSGKLCRLGCVRPQDMRKGRMGLVRHPRQAKVRMQPVYRLDAGRKIAL